MYWFEADLTVQGMEMDNLSRLVHLGVKEDFSDIHITGGHPIVYRHHGRIGFDAGREALTHHEVDELVARLLTPREKKMLRSRQSVDLARSIDHIRVRINIFNTNRGLSIAIRLLPGSVPEVQRLNLLPELKDLAKLRSGLILICGTTGSGKSTTIAALVEEINRTRSTHIVTLEDPIEYRFTSRKSFVEQRELGTHIPSFEQGLLDVLREDPDVIVVGELRERETIRLTLNAVESGHLVMATLHATNPEDALYRLCNAFPPESQDVVRTQLASTLAVCLVQKLKFYKRVGFRVPVLTVLRGTLPVKSVIRENKLSMIDGIIQTGRNMGMYSEEKYISEFLDNKEFFTAPSENFKPSEESTSESVYQTDLVDQLAPMFNANGAVYVPYVDNYGKTEDLADFPGRGKDDDRLDAQIRYNHEPQSAKRNFSPQFSGKKTYSIDEEKPMKELVSAYSDLYSNVEERSAEASRNYVITEDIPIADVIADMNKAKK